VVTARQREERIENVPVSITAFTAADIRRPASIARQDFIRSRRAWRRCRRPRSATCQVTIRASTPAATRSQLRAGDSTACCRRIRTHSTRTRERHAESSAEGPQGAVYRPQRTRRRAIVTTRKPGDEWEGRRCRAGYGSDSSYNGNVYAARTSDRQHAGSISAYTARDRRPVEEPEARLRRLRRQFSRDRRLRPAAVRARRRRTGFRAKYSELDSGAINFNGSIALATCRVSFAGPAFYEDPNNHNFRYINNVQSAERGRRTSTCRSRVTGTSASALDELRRYNDQTNFFLTDGTSDAFLLYHVNAPRPTRPKRSRLAADE